MWIIKFYSLIQLQDKILISSFYHNFTFNSLHKQHKHYAHVYNDFILLINFSIALRLNYSVKIITQHFIKNLTNNLHISHLFNTVDSVTQWPFFAHEEPLTFPVQSNDSEPLRTIKLQLKIKPNIIISILTTRQEEY